MTKVLPAASMNIPRPPVSMKDQTHVNYFVSVFGMLAAAIDERVHKARPISELLMTSPNGSVYRLVVDDLGVITTELVRAA